MNLLVGWLTGEYIVAMYLLVGWLTGIYVAAMHLLVGWLTASLTGLPAAALSLLLQ
jgi:hypothetical protein